MGSFLFSQALRGQIRHTVWDVTRIPKIDFGTNHNHSYEWVIASVMGSITGDPQPIYDIYICFREGWKLESASKEVGSRLVHDKA